MRINTKFRRTESTENFLLPEIGAATVHSNAFIQLKEDNGWYFQTVVITSLLIYTIIYGTKEMNY